MLLVEFLRSHVPVDVAGDPDPGMPQYPRHYLDLGAALQHLGRIEVPQLVWRKRGATPSRMQALLRVL